MALMGSTGREYEIWMVLHYGKLLCGSCYMAVWLAQWPQVQAWTGRRWSSNVVNVLVYNVHMVIFALSKQFRLLLNQISCILRKIK